MATILSNLNVISRDDSVSLSLENIFKNHFGAMPGFQPIKDADMKSSITYIYDVTTFGVMLYNHYQRHLLIHLFPYVSHLLERL